MKTSQVMKRYTKEFITAMIAYVITLIVSISILKSYEFPRLWQIVISIVPALPVFFVIVSLMRMIRDSDELQQRVQLLAISLSAALTGLITFSYGFLENVGFPKFPTFFVFPMLILIWGISLGYFTRRYQ